jgi:hypothetical protein
MFYLIYKITNTLSSKFYIGTHKTKNKNDGYMGSGKYLNRAYKKYGIENFTKEILFEFDNPVEMFAKEVEIVDDDFLMNENTYNLKRGGFGGFDYINESGLADIGRRRGHSNRTEDSMKRIREAGLKGSQVAATSPNRYKGSIPTEYTREKARSPESIKKRKESYLLIDHQKGKANSQYGTCWITNDIENRKIKIQELESYINSNWRKGRFIH